MRYWACCKRLVTCSWAIVIGGLPICGAPSVAQAACLLKPYDEHFLYSKAALEARDAFYASLCDESFSDLVMPDPRLKGRLSLPTKRRELAEMHYPEQAIHFGFEGASTIALVVEVDGSVGHAITIESTGHQALDEAAVAYVDQYHFDSPGSIDGIPVRVLMTTTVNFKMKEPASPFPTGLTDDVIVGLGNRIIDYCNRGDVDGLYEEIDDSAKKQLSRGIAQQRLRLYNGLYGQMVLAKYHGRMQSELKMEVPVFRLAYDIQLDRPGGEDVYMSISIVDRHGVPRIVDFGIRRGVLIGDRPPKDRSH